VVIHGSGLSAIPDSYRRYLENSFRDTFELLGTPLRVEFHQGRNPFAERKPAPLTDREDKQRRRTKRYQKRAFSR
jgi:GTP-binding protein